ncbi:hypothetical protein F5144DRAFT_505989 [Chaetomium tenue]|uniref:Uncharacterized protein n=1 Tax=Chaetomium tenue TaxID=1854479 RepID=A0ACB7PMQ1_9PEZI|nr:hypothetical protein F5144DRAFT_505989 [Chaetomium globosum]
MRSQIAALQWQLEQQFGPDPGGGPIILKQTTPEEEINPPRADNHAMFVDEVTHKTALDREPNLILSSVTSSTAPGATTATTLSSSSITSTCASSESTNNTADIAAWAHCMDWQDLDCILLPPDAPETILMDHPDRIDAGPGSITTPSELTDLMRVDLDQLYFDRVHPICPIIHRSRYFAWAAEESPGPARACLQSAMRTMAAAMSAHWGDLADRLCAETRHLLESHSQPRVTSKDEIPLEHMQAWLLLAYAELLRIGEHQAMLTAGRAFRLVQMARLYDVDALDDGQASPVATNHEPDAAFISTEERRRTFWLAFTFDRFLCLRSEWPLTLQEEMIRTRLPAPEANFQNGQPIHVNFLPAATAQNEPSTLSPFAECTVLAALYGRCLAHRRASLNDAGTKPRYDFWTHQEWLAAAVEKRIQMLAPCAAVDNEPMVLFTHLLAQSAVVFLSNTVQRASWHTPEPRLVMAAYERRAAVAALEIVRLARAVPPLSCFRVHPFLPDALTCAATFLSARCNTVVGGSSGVEQIRRALRDVQVINSLAREHYESLKLAA